jgi:hypothetical protein
MTDQLTQIENASIVQFVGQAARDGYLKGRVLDYGCGKQPYRRIVEAHGGKYVGYDREEFPANLGAGTHGPDWPVNASWNAILCTQVLQYVAEYQRLVQRFGISLSKLGGMLVMTYPTNWPEVQDVDLHRFTKAGMERLLVEAGFEIIRHKARAGFVRMNYEWVLGYGVIARA